MMMLLGVTRATSKASKEGEGDGRVQLRHCYYYF
jgi:hypothetical protein